MHGGTVFREYQWFLVCYAGIEMVHSSLNLVQHGEIPYGSILLWHSLAKDLNITEGDEILIRLDLYHVLEGVYNATAAVGDTLVTLS